MSDFTDYYQVLGVPPKASLSVIQTAYRELIKKYHPDQVAAVRAQLLEKGISPEMVEYLISDKMAEAETKCRALNEAYAVLSDRRQRQAFHKTWETVNTPKLPPKLVVTPSQYRVGHLEAHQTREIGFIITNKGGELTGDLKITKWDTTPWIINRRIEADEDTIFPIKAVCTIDPSHLKPGNYQETIVVETDGSRAELSIDVEVVEPAPARFSAPPTYAASTSHSSSIPLHPPATFWWNNSRGIWNYLEIKVGVWLLLLLSARALLLPHIPEEFLPGSTDRYLWALILFWPLHWATYWLLQIGLPSRLDMDTMLAMLVTISIVPPVLMAAASVTSNSNWINPVILILVELPSYLSLGLISRRYSRPSTQFQRLLSAALLFCLLFPAVVLLMTTAQIGTFLAGITLAWTINLYLFAL